MVHGDTLYAYSEVLEAEDADRADAGIVTFRHYGVNQDDKRRVPGRTAGADQAAQRTGADR